MASRSDSTAAAVSAGDAAAQDAPLHGPRVHEPRDLVALIFSAALLLAWVVVGVNCDMVFPRSGWRERWGRLVPHDSFPGDCGMCHVAAGWHVMKDDFRFDHGAETGHPLDGAHAHAACLRCHNDRGPVNAFVARGCGGCHPDPHKSTLGLDCTRCHGETTWRPSGLIAEHARTSFPLFGVHAAVPCERCHERAPVGDYRGAATECDLCHRADLARATVPDHMLNGWTRGCERCHKPVTVWGGVGFAHAYFPLSGPHDRPCSICHTASDLRIFTCLVCHEHSQTLMDSSHLVVPGYTYDSRACYSCHPGG